MPRKLTGLRRKRGGWQSYITIHKHQYTQTWEIAPTAQELKDWRDDQLEKYGGERDVAGGLGAAFAAYVQRRSAMPTIDQVTAHLEIWARELGRDRPPRSVRTEELDLIIDGWLKDGLAPGTVRKRRSTLRTFFSRFLGKKSQRVNPVKGSENPKEPKAEAREISYLLIERALAAMPDYCSTKPGAVKVLSLAKIVCRVIAYTGIPPGLLNAVQPHDLVLRPPGTVRITARSKGAGVEARTLPLTPEGLEAFKAFHAASAYGRVPKTVNRSFKRGCQKAGLDPKAVHLYLLRHSFLTQVYRVTRDLATVGRLGLHAEGSRVTARYAKGANQEVDAAAAQAFSAALATQRQQSLKPAPAVQESARGVPAKRARVRKSKTRKHLRRVS